MRISDWSSDVCSSDLILTLRAAPDLPDLRCDARKMKQVLVNLLSNAVKFTPAGGRILLEATTDGADGIVIEVADTGIGIAPEDIDKVMSPFGQVHEALNRDTQDRKSTRLNSSH